MKLTDWLNALPTDIDGVNVRELALKNYDKHFAPLTSHLIFDFENAVCAAFNFYESEQGFKFWYDIARKLRGMKPIDKQIKMEL